MRITRCTVQTIAQANGVRAAALRLRTALDSAPPFAANRDPRAFDDPSVVKTERSTDASLVWGQGIHLCQGASLARLEMRVALEELLVRTKRFEFTGDAPRRAAYPSNGLAALPLRVS